MAVIHPHWSRNPKLVRETTLGITVCGVKVQNDQLTAHLADTTCRACLEKARQAQEQCCKNCRILRPLKFPMNIQIPDIQAASLFPKSCSIG